MGSGQSIRSSQFITIYGPGAIIESQTGPRVILGYDKSRIFATRDPADFEIHDPRFSQQSLADARIFTLPTNAAVGEPEIIALYNTVAFPRWSLCTDHALLYRRDLSAQHGDHCPRCRPARGPFQANEIAARQAIRFVITCEKGHLDDVPWTSLIRHSGDSCRPSYLIWEGAGGQLKSVTIRCPLCRQSVNLGTAYARELRCSGNFPEYLARENCDGVAKIQQRGAANLRMSEVQTALTIPPHDSRLVRMLQRPEIAIIVDLVQPTDKDTLMAAIAPQVERGRVKAHVAQAIGGYSAADIEDALSTPQQEDAHAATFIAELRALRHAAINGAPRRRAENGQPADFEVKLSGVKSVSVGNLSFRISPISRLRVVMVQRGYRRINPMNELVERRFSYNNEDWLPGVELYGEGIFIELTSPFILEENAAWIEAQKHPDNYSRLLGDAGPLKLRQDFVWWHTLAHRLINSIALHSGYNSSSIRERVYIDGEDHLQLSNGGVLIYTADNGGDGTLGGLVDLVRSFDDCLRRALRDIDSCSNDPLCGESYFGADRVNGAACYACSLVAETSCEHRNMFLDRILIVDSLRQEE